VIVQMHEGIFIDARQCGFCCADSQSDEQKVSAARKVIQIGIAGRPPSEVCNDRGGGEATGV
jgi:hypothetical protein